MKRFVDFILYNTIVYAIYWLIDTIFTFLNFYSSDELGNDLTVMPTDSDFTYIIINIVISATLGYYIFKKIKKNVLE